MRRLSILVCSFVLSYVFLAQYSNDNIDLNNFAIGEKSTPYFARDRDNFPIHLYDLDLDKLDSLISGWSFRGEKNVILILGNSQTYAINQQGENEVSYNRLLFDEFGTKYDVITQSFPNASLPEFYLSLFYLKSKLPIKYVLIPAFLDDMREDRVNATFLGEIFTERIFSELRADIKTEAYIQSKIADYLESSSMLDKDEISAQDIAESYLNGQMTNYSGIWSERAKMRGKISVFLYMLRNTIFGITPNTKRAMIPSRYRKNITALEDLLILASSNNIKALVYIPPIRNDISYPYVESEYVAYKDEVENTCRIQGALFLNLEFIVPGEYWGYKPATSFRSKKEADFMHFEYGGHELLYRDLRKGIIELIK